MDREQIEQIAYQAMSRRKAHLYREKGFVYRLPAFSLPNASSWRAWAESD